jgi:membrane protein YqaA with SNARE-associated domain
MKIFTPIYQRILLWSQHKSATSYLAGLSFAEAIIFPIPPEVMLAPMCLTQPRQGFRFASVSLASSMLGAVIGYLLGHYTYELLGFVFEALGWVEKIDARVSQLRELSAQSPWQTFWLLVLAGFTPIPLKIFTWASGIVGLPFLPFMASMLVGRGKRVYLIALAIRLGGERAARILDSFIEPIGWFFTAILVLGLGYLGFNALAGV